MESNNYEWFITQTVEAMLPRFSDRNLVLVMKIDASWHDYGYDESGMNIIREPSSYRREVFLAFHRPSNYTKVLMGDITEPNHGLLPQKGTVLLKQLSDHDSCWRSSGMSWVFDTFVNAWEFFDNRGVEGRKIDPSFHYSIFHGYPTYWEIESLKLVDPKDRWGSDYELKLLREVPMHEISKFMPQPEKN
jgi:hypothetical protein